MLRTRAKRLAIRSEAAMQRLVEVEASIMSLEHEDLLDLADIFRKEPRTPLGQMAFGEMARRGISL